MSITATHASLLSGESGRAAVDRALAELDERRRREAAAEVKAFADAHRYGWEMVTHAAERVGLSDYIDGRATVEEKVHPGRQVRIVWDDPTGTAIQVTVFLGTASVTWQLGRWCPDHGFQPECSFDNIEDFGAAIERFRGVPCRGCA